MKKLVIAVDCDDVLVDSSTVIMAAYNAKYNTKLNLDAYYRLGPEKWGIDAEVAIRRIDTLLRDDHVVDGLAPTHDAVDAIKKLAQNHKKLINIGLN